MVCQSVSQHATYVDKVLKLYSPGGVQLDLLQCLSHDIVWLSLALLGSLDGSTLVDVSLVVDVELAESVLQAEDLVLLELWELSRSMRSASRSLTLT